MNTLYGRMWVHIVRVLVVASYGCMWSHRKGAPCVRSADRKKRTGKMSQGTENRNRVRRHPACDR